MDQRQAFGLVLKRFRLASGLTHEALAERASLSARTISDLERGVSRAPRADTLALLVEALELPPEQRAVLEAARLHAAITGRAIPPTRGVTNLPVPLTSFVGRQRETGAVGDLLRRDDIRLVTLTGPGGIGKTRLALHVAIQLDEAFPDGKVAVDLAPVSSPDAVSEALARAVGVPDEHHLSRASLIATLKHKQLLLVLDNFEHLLAAAPLVTDVLRGCPRLKVLATSRAALRLSGEQEFPVPPLPVPDLTHLPQVEDPRDYAAVRLFVDRAVRVRPDFALTADNAAAVVAICAQLDGLPLGVELAAARVRALPPRILLQRLQLSNLASLDLLVDGPRDVPIRQQTLRATIAWSHDLLGEDDRALFRRLAVFTGGCTLEAAEAISNPPQEPSRRGAFPVREEPVHEIDVVDGLHSLVDKGLVVQDDAPRFRLLETIRAFAWEQLAASGEEAIVRRSHAHYYLGLVEAAGAILFATERTRTRLAADQGNIQVSLQWLVQHG